MSETLKETVPSSLASSSLVPLDVYMRTFDYEPDAEYVDGVIEERALPTYDHAAWQAAILIWFHNHRQQWNVRALAELRIQVAPTRVCIPDVTVLDRTQPVEQVPTRPPIAVFEVLSPEDKIGRKRFQRKLEDYQAMGIRQIWIVDPEEDSFSRYEEGAVTRQDTFCCSTQGIVFAVAEIRALLDAC